MSDSTDQILTLPIAVPAEWERVPLREVVEFVADGDWVESKDQGGSDFRLIQISNIGTGSFVETGNLRYITADTFDRLRCTEILAGDVLVARMPEPTGRAWFVSQLQGRCITAVDVAIVRPLPERVDGRYLSYFLNTPVNLSRVDGLATGTTRRRVRRADLARLEIPVPPIGEQRAIAGVLGVLDNKIESNRRQCRILDELALTSCKKLFRSDLESDTGSRLGDIAAIALGGTPSRSRPEFWNDGRIAWINSGALHERPLITASDMITDEGLRSSATKIVPSGSTVVAITGATLGVVSRLGIDAAINQSVVGIYVPESRELTDYIYIWMRLNIARLVSSATGAAQQHVNKSNFEDLRISLPNEAGLRSMVEVSSLLDAQTTLSRQNKSLVALRESLLPELLSGRLRVRDAEKVVEGAV